MHFSISLIAAILIIGFVAPVQAAPQLLENLPLESPEGNYAANVEWDDAGFIGRIKMLIYKQGSTPVKTVELPQMKPAPANLSWISETWVACESFVAEMGAAFFYMDVERNKGYLLEVLAPDAKQAWIITFNTNDSVSSDTIHTLSRGHSCLFPILLRDLPQEGFPYLTPDFAYVMSDAVDSYTQWRKKEKFTEMKFISDMDENPATGRLIIASLDSAAELIYFPQGTTTTREMLTLTRRQKLPETVQSLLGGINPPELSVQWIGDNGEFTITGMVGDGGTTRTELVRGKLEGVKDSAYTGPGITELLKESKSTGPPSDKGKDLEKSAGNSIKAKSSSSKSSSRSSGSKRPSRSN